MTESEELVTDLMFDLLHYSHVTIGNDAKLKVKGYGKVVITPELSIEKVLLVESLSYNLLSVRQLCKVGYTVIFNLFHVTVLFTRTLKVAFVAFVENNLYVVDFSKETTQVATLLMAKADMGWLWHRRLAHVGMRNLHNLVKGEHVVGITNVNFPKIVLVVLALLERCMKSITPRRPSSPPRGPLSSFTWISLDLPHMIVLGARNIA